MDLLVGLRKGKYGLENSELKPSAERNQTIMWPATNDKRWESFDSLVVERFKVEQEGKCFKERMAAHCRIVYEEGLKQFGSSSLLVKRTVQEEPVRDATVKDILDPSPIG